MNGGGTRMLTPVSNASGGSGNGNGNGNGNVGSSRSRRLSTYFMVIVTIIFTVLILTVSSMQFLETAFGSWGGRKGPGHNRDNGNNGASSIRIRNVTHTASKNNQKINGVKNSIERNSILNNWIDIDGNDDSNDDSDTNSKDSNTNTNSNSNNLRNPDKEKDKEETTTITTGQTEIVLDQNQEKEEEYTNKNEEEKKKEDNIFKEDDEDEEKEIVLDEDGWVTNPIKDVVEVVEVGEIDVSEGADAGTTNEDDDDGDEDNDDDDDDDDDADNTTTTKLSLLDSVLKARTKMIKKLRKDYGDEYYEKIFHIASSKSKSNKNDSNGNELKKNKDTQDPDRPRSTHMMKYRFIRPIVYTDREGHRSDYTKDGIKDNIVAKNNINNFQRKLIIKILRSQKNDGNNNNKYVWATGGHSAAAGHGNLFYESYTKQFEATASNVFNAAGLQLETRNYAMGATSSASEMSMCYNEIYGNDIDIFSWDFGMLEARDYLKGRMLHYIMRGLLSTSATSTSSSKSISSKSGSQSSSPIVVPAFIGLQEINEPRKQIIQQLNDAFIEQSSDNDDKDDEDSITTNNNGLALFLGDNDLFIEMKDSIPETLGLSGDEIKALPTNVRNFKCNDGIEKGEPYCGDEKYTMDECPKRMGMASWHPGWKYHAMVGNSIALFVIDMLIDSIKIIDEYSNSNSDSDDNNKTTDILLERLLKEEEIYYQMLINGPLPEFAKTVYWYNNTSDRYHDHPSQDEYFIKNNMTVPTEEEKQKYYYPIGKNASNTFFRGPSICHTARLPSQTRYYGTLMNEPIESKDDSITPTISEVIWPNVTYYIGIEDEQLDIINTKKLEQLGEESQSQSKSKQEKERKLQLSYTMKGEREQYECPDCTAVTHIDYRDFFYIESESIIGKDVWTALEFPNQEEQKEYNYKQNLLNNKYEGILILIFRYCGFDQCEDGFLGYKEYNEGKKYWEMTVNNEIVTKLTKIGHDAIILENENGIKFIPNDQGVYDIKIKVNDPTGFLKISAFVLY